MKPKHAAAVASNAREVLRAIGIRPDQDFHTLSSSQVDAIVKEADAAKYQKPRNANGSRGRYFHALLVRRARHVTPSV